MVSRRIGIVFDIDVCNVLPETILQVHIQNLHFVLCLFDQFFHLTALAQILNHIRIIGIFLSNLDPVICNGLNVDPILSVCWQVTSCDSVQQCLVVNNNIRDTVRVIWNTDLKNKPQIM